MNDVQQPTAVPTDLAGLFPQLISWNGTRHFLVVDDSEPVAIVISKAAAKLGFTSDVAADGPQAVAMFAENPTIYALALVDMRLPGGMSGADVIRELRRIRPDMPAVVTSGYSYEEAAAAFESLDSAEYLQKPFRLDSLGAAVRAALAPQLRRESR
jgi:DNA-binding NtrC family response regulator